MGWMTSTAPDGIHQNTTYAGSNLINGLIIGPGTGPENTPGKMNPLSGVIEVTTYSPIAGSMASSPLIAVSIYLLQ
ncbi:hypothetical protein BO83DRAFT_186647 [Aspergillus eucalypticola CBS 122712]|uniref:Uncharacterized protein n=1 Tax=Aspergillus eucalypticola (strain CBS 122712 / IBT 29274) TaxID=1448314 RepID=A0A317URJ3_ASPEC|nr:uncharacterized protein BO83DRAFT_186647 [Aspergillus eucalypticola CBS 122712]PWY62660.1 hypothetical protein BO83DRAFT_186647 [Aspergillus eucalypticola CBS 122712]